MDKTQERHTVRSADKATNRSQLRLDRQTIRTLTGAELRLVGGASSCHFTHTTDLTTF